LSKVNPFSNGAIYAKLDGFYAAKPFGANLPKFLLKISALILIKFECH